MHSQRKEIKADHGPERPALGAFHQSLQPELCVRTICTCTVKCCPLSEMLPAQTGPATHGMRSTVVSPRQTSGLKRQTDPLPPPPGGGLMRTAQQVDQSPHQSVWGPLWGMCHDAYLSLSHVA